MNGHLITIDGTVATPTVDAVRDLLGRSQRFWLDLQAPTQEEQDAVLRDLFHFHPLALEDAANFGQRPKVDTYDDFLLFVAFGVDQAGQLVEVHVFYTEQYLVTVRRHECPAIGELVDRMSRHTGRADHVMLLYRLMDTLVDTYFPVLSAMDDRIDELEDEILVRPTEGQLGTLFDLKRSLISLRKVVTPQRDMFASLLTTTDTIPGMTDDAERYFRDVYDHLIRISDLVDSYRDLLSGALDTHLSTVSNRLNVVMKQLTIIATVFMPITFVTGFFGQNFGWMVNRLGSLGIFIGLGVALQVVLGVGTMYTFRRRGWLTADATDPASSPPSRPRASAERRWRTVHPGPLREFARPFRATTAGTGGGAAK